MIVESNYKHIHNKKNSNDITIDCSYTEHLFICLSHFIISPDKYFLINVHAFKEVKNGINVPNVSLK